MMPPVRMTLLGARDLEAALRGLPTAALKKAVIQRAFRKSGQPIVDAANALLPPAARARGLEVEIRAGLSRRQRRARAASKDSVEMFLGLGPSRLAHLFEFGTAPRWTRPSARSPSGGGGGKRAYRGVMPATPYLRPSWDGGNRKMLDDFARLLWKEIEATARRYARRQARLLARSGRSG